MSAPLSAYYDVERQCPGNIAKRCAWAYGLIGHLWQRECDDHIERKTNSDTQRIVAYILNNPVKAGLVARWEDHPYTHLIQHP